MATGTLKRYRNMAVQMESLELNGTAVTATAAELNALDGATATATEVNALAGVTAGTATASKAVVLGASKEIATITTATVTNLTTTALTFGTGGTLDADSGTASATTGAATLNKMAGVITSEALTTAAGSEYTLTLTNSVVAAADMVFASVAYGTAAAGTPTVTRITPGSGSAVILVKNTHASAAFDGTIKISFFVVKA